MFSIDIEDYCVEHGSIEPELLQELRRYTHLHTVQPRMMCSWQQGMLLRFVSMMIKPQNILEIGTFTGYSALCMVDGLQNNGSLHTYDTDDEVLEIAKKFISRSNRAFSIVIHNIDAKLDAYRLGIEFDMVYLDGNKCEYLQDYEAVVPLLRSGGFLLADNVLWSGKIIEKMPQNDHQTVVLQQFNDYVRDDSRVEKVILPIRDGLSILRKR
jgi:predicted O-methyltransferase YrrM